MMESERLTVTGINKKNKMQENNGTIKLWVNMLELIVYVGTTFWGNSQFLINLIM